jgi:LPS-assembly protein
MPDYYVSLGHTYKKVLAALPNSIPANDMDLSFRYSYNEKIKFNGGLTYNIDESSSKQWRFGGSYNRDCWSMAASIRQDITPRPEGFTTDNTFFVQFNFIPFGSIGTGSVNQ